MLREITETLTKIVEAVEAGEEETILLLARRYARLHKLVRRNNR